MFFYRFIYIRLGKDIFPYYTFNMFNSIQSVLQDTLDEYPICTN